MLGNVVVERRRPHAARQHRILIVGIQTAELETGSVRHDDRGIRTVRLASQHGGPAAAGERKFLGSENVIPAHSL